MNADKRLKEIRIDLIDRNPENPRIVFRQEEMDSLLISIQKFGVQVPISVYKEGSKFILIDGERRWRTCQKLNFDTIPAIIQEKPDPLDNLLLMFNIHALREQWDLFTISHKITRIIELLRDRLGRDPNELELSKETGLTRGVIRRCNLLIRLPERFKEMILNELHKPKSKQNFTEDFFIEMETNLKTVKNSFPDLVENLDDIRDVLIKKYESGVITNIIDFRMLAKLARSPKNVSYSEDEARRALEDIFSDNRVDIGSVYKSTVGDLYDEKKLISNFSNVQYYIENLTPGEIRDQDIRSALVELRTTIDKILTTK